MSRAVRRRDRIAGSQDCRVRQEHDVDLIVMGTHGRGAVERMWVGSVTEGVLQRAAVPGRVCPRAAAVTVHKACTVRQLPPREEEA